MGFTQYFAKLHVLGHCHLTFSEANNALGRILEVLPLLYASFSSLSPKMMAQYVCRQV